MSDLDFKVKNGLIVTEDALILDTTDSTSKDTGALILEGGIGAEKNITSGGNITANKGLVRSGNVSSTAWGVNGIGLKSEANTFTDTSSSGTVSKIVLHSINAQTLASSNTITATEAANLYIAGGISAGSNTTITNGYALLVDAGNVKFNTDLTVTGNIVGSGNLDFAGNLEIDGNTTLGNNLTDVVTINASTVNVPNGITMTVENTANNAVTTPLILRHTLSNTPSDGVGVGIGFAAETSAGNNEIGATIEAYTTSSASGSEDFNLLFKTMADGSSATTALEVTSNGNIIVTNNIYASGNLELTNDGYIWLGDNLLDSGAAIRFYELDGFGVDVQNNNMVVISNEHGTTNQAMILGNTASGDAGTLFGLSITSAGGSPGSLSAGTAVWTNVLRVTGAGDIYAGGLQQTPVGDITRSTGAFTTLAANGATTFNPANANVAIQPTGTGTVTIAPGTTAGNINRMNIGATTRGTGAFTTLAANSTVSFTANTASTSNTTGTLRVTGGMGVSGRVSASNIVLNGNISSTSHTTGTVIVTGGVGISENLNVNGNLDVNGTLTVDGLTATINATSVSVQDPIITIAGTTAPSSNDSKDKGILFNYYDTQARLGFIGYDISDNTFRLLTNVTNSSEVVTGTTGNLISNVSGDITSGNVTITGGTINGTTIGVTTKASGGFTTIAATGDVSITSNTASSSTSTGALKVSGGAGIAGAIYAGSIQNTPIGSTTRSTGAFTTLAANGATTINGSNSTVIISPTGTGTVTISPAGALTINPTTVSNINNTNIGASTRGTGAFTTLAANNAVTFTANTGSSSTITGTVVVTGGVGVSQNLNIGGATSTVGLTTTGVLTANPANANISMQPTGTGTITMNPATAGTINNMSIGATNRSTGAFTTLTANSTTTITNTTESTSADSGAFQVDGGVGINKRLNVGALTTTVGLTSTSTTTLSPANANVVISPTGTGTVTISPATTGSINNTSVGATTRGSGAFTTLAANSATTFTAGTSSTSKTTGAVIVTGGVGISENLNVGGSLTVDGNLTVKGTTVRVDSIVTTIDDPVITLGGDTAPTVDDNKDRGIEFRWHNGTSAKIGFFGYDDSLGEFTFIPDASNSAEVFSGTVGTIRASLNGAVTSSSVDIDGGAIDSTPIGATTASTGRFTTLSVTGNTTLGDATTDTITFTGRVASHLLPNTDNARDLGSTGNEWRNLYIDGTANIDSLVADTVDINAGSIDNATVGASTASTGAFTTLTSNGATTFTANTTSSNTTTGTVVVTGGVGVSGNINAGSSSFAGLTSTSTTTLSPANANVVISPTGTGTVTISPATAGTINNTSVGATTRSTGAFTTLAANNTVSFTQNSGATSTTTGTLRVTGGVGISERLYAGSIQNTPIGSVTQNTALFTTLGANSTVSFTANTAASSTTTGTLRVTGGAGFTGTVYATAFNGPLTGNASTATTLQTARTIAISGGATGTATSFNGSADITIPVTALNANNINAGTIGDAYLPDSISSNITGNAATATVLQTARTINGVSFNGSANITIADSTKLPTTGGTMTGNITFSDDQEGVVWSRNSDSASIRFYNVSDGDTNSRLEFNTADNGNEFFRWTTTSGATTYELATLRLVSNVGNLALTGDLTARSKSFLIDHPTKDKMKLRYTSLEGPEAGVYVRGRLTDSNTIELPDYWSGLVDEDTITVNLTPIGKHQKLYVEDIADNRIIIGNDNLVNKKINCFYTVFAERKDMPKLIVEFEDK